MKWRKLRQTNEWKNYIWIIIMWKSYLVHRLVASAFLWLELSDTKTLICHKDDNPENNNINNLFIGTHNDNMQDASKKNRMKNKLNSKSVYKIRLLIKEWISDRKIGKIMWVSWVSIFKIRHNSNRCIDTAL